MFGTSGIRGRVGDEVTCDLALAVGRALASEGYDRVVVGRDARESGRMLADAAVSGLRECGADAVRLGEAATPTVARSVGWFDADAGLMVTASHNPAPDNGLKLWNPSGQAFDERQRETIASRVREDDFDLRSWDELGGVTERDDAAERHAAEVVRGAASGDLSIVVDVGNGVGQVTAEALRRLGHDVVTLNERPDGSFPARPSEPTAENCRALSSFVAGGAGTASGTGGDAPRGFDADLGIAHDGDADRMRAVTERGEFVSGDLLLALFAREAANPGDEVAVPVDTSLTVADLLETQGVSVSRTRVGDVYVAERATDPGVAFGGEPSGAWIWPDETLCPDGPLAACRLAGLVSRRGSLDALVGEVERYPLRRGNVETDRKEAVVERVRERAFAAYDDVTTLDGVRVGTDDGWFLVRASGTQPLVRVTAEARSEARTDELFAEARGLVEDASR
ncbi:phosphoglucosamine mutase [Halorussus sp. MSC15.2]|uniref:phosphoglucosamine mutase n=1 Tax=Halorussus sp. MSC15.2 TaxID=2283638 RepID=UPI0013D4C919|nr:phosphoglucosamine mutase [Halorussus sp. MSC15.2]NEU56512.1 phosphoglucosamine mutase [Halorussus sp. MSC15.2]